MYASNALFFPHHLIPTLRRLRGAEWQALIERVITLPELHEETLALMLMVARLDGCAACETDSYRAMRGCAACAAQTLRRYKGSDADLLEAYENALADIRAFTTAHCAMQPPSLFGDVIAQASRVQP
jgi:hypothetical protein